MGKKMKKVQEGAGKFVFSNRKSSMQDWRIEPSIEQVQMHRGKDIVLLWFFQSGSCLCHIFMYCPFVFQRSCPKTMVEGRGCNPELSKKVSFHPLVFRPRSPCSKFFWDERWKNAASIDCCSSWKKEKIREPCYVNKMKFLRAKLENWLDEEEPPQNETQERREMREIWDDHLSLGQTTGGTWMINHSRTNFAGMLVSIPEHWRSPYLPTNA